MHIVTQTPRLVIREFLAKERDSYLDHFNDEQVIQYIPKRSREERINIFNKALAAYENSKSTGIWGIFDKSNGAFIGSCLLRNFNDDAGTLELGYSLEQQYWSKGIGSEMASAMVSYGFSANGVHEIVAVTELENTGSMRVLEKAGLSRQDNFIRNGLELAFFKVGREQS